MKNFSYFVIAAILTIVALSLMGCQPKVIKEYVEVPVEVKVPVAIKCTVAYPEAPKTDIGKLDNAPRDVELMGVLLMQEHEEYRRYAKELQIILTQCSESR